LVEFGHAIPYTYTHAHTHAHTHTHTHTYIHRQAWVNALLTAYIGSIAVLLLAGAMAPYFTDFFPTSIRSKSITLPAFKILHLLDSPEPTVITLPQIVFGIISAAFCTWSVY